MFGLGWGEVLVVAVAALLILGPDKMPEAARQAGRAYGRLRRFLIEAQAGWRTEMDLADLERRPADEPESKAPAADDPSGPAPKI